MKFRYCFIPFSSNTPSASLEKEANLLGDQGFHCKHAIDGVLIFEKRIVEEPGRAKISDEDWVPWRSGKGGESKHSDQDPELAKFLEDGKYFHPVRWKGMDGYDYWLSRTDDGALFIHRVKRTSPKRR